MMIGKATFDTWEAEHIAMAKRIAELESENRMLRDGWDHRSAALEAERDRLRVALEKAHICIDYGMGDATKPGSLKHLDKLAAEAREAREACK